MTTPFPVARGRSSCRCAASPGDVDMATMTISDNGDGLHGQSRKQAARAGPGAATCRTGSRNRGCRTPIMARFGPSNSRRESRRSPRAVAETLGRIARATAVGECIRMSLLAGIDLLSGQVHASVLGQGPSKMHRRVKKARRRPGRFARCRSPLLSAVPVIDVLASLIFRKAISLLNSAFQLIPATADHIEIIIGELAPFLLNFAFDLLPISLDPIPVHVTPP